jgi:predicted porin
MRLLKHLLLASAAGLLAVSAAQAADLPTKKAPPAAATPNCYASFWTWLDSTAADCPLSLYGITVYGTIDVGGGYETHASGFNSYFPQGVAEVVSRSSGNARWQWVPNGLSQSNVGIKMKEQFAPGWSIVGDVNLGFDPYSFELANGPESLVQNNPYGGASSVQRSANGDSSRAGQWDNSRGYVGVSNTTFGTLTVGRQYAFTNDLVNNYDPMGGSYAFSLIGYSSTYVAGDGATEMSRYNTSLKYQVAYNGFRAGALWDFGNYSTGDSTNGAYQFDVGFDYAGFSLDAIYSYANDAVTLVNSTAPSAGVGFGPLSARIANVAGGAVAAKYKVGPFTAFGGYADARFSTATDSYAVDAYNNGFDSIAGIQVLPHIAGNGNEDSLSYYNHRNLQTVWGGAKYAILSNLDVTGAYYYVWQNNFDPTAGACATPNLHGQCQGNLEAVSGMIDWRPWKRVDVYGGVMYSQAAGGLDNGAGPAFVNNNNTAFTGGVRVNF